jgi:hypothetical protein
MTEPKRLRLRDDSDALLRELAEVRELEEEKRNYRIATPRFRRLAELIERKSREIFVRATDQRVTGETVSAPQAIAIEDVDPRNP